MNDFFDVIERRYSVRTYQNAPIDEETLKTILEAATRAPSAGNLQAYEIVVVRDAEHKKRLAEAALDQWFIKDVPAVLVFFANPDRGRWDYTFRSAELYALHDATIACAYAQLAATACGLGSCWVGSFNDTEVRHVLHAPDQWRPISLLTIGHPAEPPKTSPRRPISELVFYERVRKETALHAH